MWNLSWAIPASIATIMIWAVSAVANYEFGLTQGTTEPVQILWFTVTTSMMNGYASLAVDVLKVALPATAVVAWVMRKHLAAISVAVMFMLCLAWSAQNSVGYVLSNHSRAVDGRGQTADQWSALQKTLEETQRSRGLVPEHRPSAVVNANIEATKADRKFADSASCSNPAGGRAINFCNNYRGLTAELAAAQSADRLDAQLLTLRQQLDNRKRVTDADPLGTAAAALLGMQRSTVSTGRSVSFSLLVEVISAAGLALIWGIFFAAWRDKRDRRAAAAKALTEVTESLKAEVDERIERLTAERAANAVRVAEIEAEQVAEAPKPRTPPPGGPRTRATVKKPEAEPAIMTVHDDVTPEGRPAKFAERTFLSEMASDFFEESTPPQKYRVERRREERKHKAMGSAKEWLRECTERSSDMSVVCSTDDAWLSYRTWCEAEKMKMLPRSKFERTINARIGNVSVNGRKAYIGLVLLEAAAEKIRVAA